MDTIVCHVVHVDLHLAEGVCFVEAAGVPTCADLLVRTSCRISSRSPADVMSCAIAPGRMVVVVVVVLLLLLLVVVLVVVLLVLLVLVLL